VVVKLVVVSDVTFDVEVKVLVVSEVTCDVEVKVEVVSEVTSDVEVKVRDVVASVVDVFVEVVHVSDREEWKPNMKFRPLLACPLLRHSTEKFASNPDLPEKWKLTDRLA
jgi:hypothetical protein